MIWNCFINTILCLCIPLSKMYGALTSILTSPLTSPSHCCFLLWWWPLGLESCHVLIWTPQHYHHWKMHWCTLLPSFPFFSHLLLIFLPLPHLLFHFQLSFEWEGKDGMDLIFMLPIGRDPRDLTSISLFLSSKITKPDATRCHSTRDCKRCPSTSLY